MIRNPAVAGQFYPGEKGPLANELKSLIKRADEDIDALGVLSPHAGYPYSGAVSGLTLGAIKPKPVYIIMGPNHTGLGQPFGISSAKGWRTPLGEVEIDKALADEITAGSKYIRYDDLSCAQEHSVEVQLPFLQFLQKDFKFIPIIISYAPLAVYREIGFELSRAIKKCGIEKGVTIVASSDMTHYESGESAKKKDDVAIRAMLDLDEGKLVESVARFDISMCGYAPAAIMISAVKELGAKHAKLIKYTTSGDATGDYSSVVGYAGIVIE